MKNTELIKQADEALEDLHAARHCFNLEEASMLMTKFHVFSERYLPSLMQILKKYEEALVNVGGYYSHNNDIEAVFNIARKALEEE